MEGVGPQLRVQTNILRTASLRARKPLAGCVQWYAESTSATLHIPSVGSILSQALIVLLWTQPTAKLQWKRAQHGAFIEPLSFADPACLRQIILPFACHCGHCGHDALGTLGQS